MKNKKLVSLITTASLIMSGIGFAPIKASAAVISNNDVQALQNVKTDMLQPLNSILAANVGTSNVTELSNALLKNQKIASAHQTQECTVKISGLDLDNSSIPDENKMAIQLMLNALQNVRISSDSTFKGNTDQTQMKMVNGTSIAMGPMINLSMKSWYDIDLAASTPKVNMVFQIPSMIKSILPMLQDSIPPTGSEKDDKFIKDMITQLSTKDYIIYDTTALLDALKSIPGEEAPSLSDDFMKKSMDFGKEFGKKFAEYFTAVLSSSESTIVTPKGSESINGETMNVYEVTLNNQNLSKLIETLSKDASFKKLLTDYINGMNALQSGEKLPSVSDSDFDAAFAQIISALKSDNGGVTLNTTIKYAVNKEGFIAHTDGKINLVVDSAKLLNEKGSPVISVSFDYSNNIDKINAVTDLEPLPALTDANSIDLAKVLAASIEAENKTKADKWKKTTEISTKFTKQNINNVKKPWTVTFNTKLNVDTVIPDNVVIVDDNYLPIRANIQLGSDEKTIIITPLVSYEKGKSYHVIINTGVESKTGKHLSAPVTADFTIQ